MLSPYFPVVSAPLFLAPFGGCYRDITFLNPRETRWKADTLLQSTSLPRLRTWDDWNTEEPLFGQVTLANWAMEALALGMWIKPWKIRRLLNIGMILGDLIWICLNYDYTILGAWVGHAWDDIGQPFLSGEDLEQTSSRVCVNCLTSVRSIQLVGVFVITDRLIFEWLIILDPALNIVFLHQQGYGLNQQQFVKIWKTCPGFHGQCMMTIL